MNSTWAYVSPETIIAGNFWLHCSSLVSEKELVAPEECVIASLDPLSSLRFSEDLEEKLHQAS